MTHEQEAQMLGEVARLCEFFTCGKNTSWQDYPQKIHELNGLSVNFSYMEIERLSMMAFFKRYSELQRESAKREAWARVMDQIYRLQTIAGSAIPRKATID